VGCGGDEFVGRVSGLTAQEVFNYNGDYLIMD